MTRLGGNVFGVNDTPLFDAELHTQGGQPHLLQLLLNKYREHLAGKIEERKKAKLPTPVDADTATRATSALTFLKWASDYLKENRPAGNFFVDENLGLKLSNNLTCVISPGINIQGTMQDSGAISVTHGQSQQGNEGVVPSADFKI